MVKNLTIGNYEINTDDSDGERIVFRHIETGREVEIYDGYINIPNLRVEAYLGSNQSVSPDGTFNKVTIDTVQIDEFGDSFDTSSNEWIAPTDGKYRIRAVVYVGNLGQGNQLEAEIRVNGSVVQRSSGHGALTANIDVPVEDSEELSKDDKVSLHAAVTAGSGKDLLSDVFRTNMSVHKIG